MKKQVINKLQSNSIFSKAGATPKYSPDLSPICENGLKSSKLCSQQKIKPKQPPSQLDVISTQIQQITSKITQAKKLQQQVQRSPSQTSFLKNKNLKLDLKLNNKKPKSITNYLLKPTTTTNLSQNKNQDYFSSHRQSLSQKENHQFNYQVHHLYDKACANTKRATTDSSPMTLKQHTTLQATATPDQSKLAPGSSGPANVSTLVQVPSKLTAQTTQPTISPIKYLRANSCTEQVLTDRTNDPHLPKQL